MPKTLYIALITLLTGCGSGTPVAWRSELGVYVAKNDMQNYFTSEVIDLYAGHAVEGLAALGYPRAKLETITQSTVVCVMEKPFTYGPGPQTYNGIQVWSELYIAAMPCVHNTALQHEMLHFYLDALTMDPDAGHTRSEIWALDVPLGVCP